MTDNKNRFIQICFKSFGEDKGHSSVKAIPPKVVASKSGINLGFATSSHGGKVNLFLEGTTSSLIEDL